jgi:hypothetical protein
MGVDPSASTRNPSRYSNASSDGFSATPSTTSVRCGRPKPVVVASTNSSAMKAFHRASGPDLTALHRPNAAHGGFTVWKTVRLEVRCERRRYATEIFKRRDGIHVPGGLRLPSTSIALPADSAERAARPAWRRSCNRTYCRKTRSGVWKSGATMRSDMSRRSPSTGDASSRAEGVVERARNLLGDRRAGARDSRHGKPAECSLDSPRAASEDDRR